MTHEELLAAIGAALGDSEPYREETAERAKIIHRGSGTSSPISRSREVLGGAMASDGRVGWIEERSDSPVDGHVPVEIDVRVVEHGRLHVSPLETYNPFFGCSVRFAAWVADGFVFVYSEKHQTLLSRFAEPFTEQALLVLGRSPTVVGERLVHLDEKEGVVHVRRLGDLRPGIAVLTPQARDGSRPKQQELRLSDDGKLEHAVLVSAGEVPGIDAMEWSEVYPARRRHSRWRELPLPPDLPLPPADELRERWLGLLRGVPEARLVVDTLGEPWLAPEEPSREYIRGYRGRDPAAERLPMLVRQGLPKSERIYGWPSEGSFEERLDRVFLSAVGRAAR